MDFRVIWLNSESCIFHESRSHLSIVLVGIFKRILLSFKLCVLIWLVWKQIVLGNEGWHWWNMRTFYWSSGHTHSLLFNFPLIWFLFPQKCLQVLLESVKGHLATQFRVDLSFDFAHVHFRYFSSTQFAILRGLRHQTMIIEFFNFQFFSFDCFSRLLEQRLVLLLVNGVVFVLIAKWHVRSFSVWLHLLNFIIHIDNHFALLFTFSAIFAELICNNVVCLIEVLIFFGFQFRPSFCLLLLHLCLA